MLNIDITVSKDSVKFRKCRVYNGFVYKKPDTVIDAIVSIMVCVMVRVTGLAPRRRLYIEKR